MTNEKSKSWGDIILSVGFGIIVFLVLAAIIVVFIYPMISYKMKGGIKCKPETNMCEISKNDADEFKNWTIAAFIGSCVLGSTAVGFYLYASSQKQSLNAS